MSDANHGLNEDANKEPSAPQLCESMSAPDVAVHSAPAGFQVGPGQHQSQEQHAQFIGHEPQNTSVSIHHPFLTGADSGVEMGEGTTSMGLLQPDHSGLPVEIPVAEAVAVAPVPSPAAHAHDQSAAVTGRSLVVGMMPNPVSAAGSGDMSGNLPAPSHTYAVAHEGHVAVAPYTQMLRPNTEMASHSQAASGLSALTEHGVVFSHLGLVHEGVHEGEEGGAMMQASKRPWTKQEDDLLLKLVQKHGSKDWTSICAEISGRNRKQCRERYKNHLEGHVKKGSWTQEEDNLIFEWQKKVGNKWSVISQYLPNRTDNAVKNRYWSATRSRERKARKEAKKRAIATQAISQPEEKKMRVAQEPSSSSATYSLSAAVAQGEEGAQGASAQVTTTMITHPPSVEQGAQSSHHTGLDFGFATGPRGDEEKGHDVEEKGHASAPTQAKEK